MAYVRKLSATPGILDIMTGFKTVAALANEDAGSFGLAVAFEVFNEDRSSRGVPRFDFALCATTPGPVRMEAGLTIQIEHGLERLADADLVLVLPWHDFDQEPPDATLDALRAAHARGAIVASQCTGAFVLAAAGLLDDKRATTHWRYADRLAQLFPKVKVDPDVLYVDEGQILTSAGTAAGVDQCLYLLRREHGAAVATTVARDMIVPAHRDGGQAQFVAAPIAAECTDERLGEVLVWVRDHLDQPISVDALAARANMSPRSFARHFRAVNGTSPHAWLLTQRLHRAEELLETSDLPIEVVANRSGFGTAAALREQFTRRRGVPPREYRRTFRATLD